MGTSCIINSSCPGHRKKRLDSSIAHPVSRVKHYTCSLVMPRPQQGWLGPPLSGIGITVLLGCPLSSFTERSFMDDWLLASIPCSPLFTSCGSLVVSKHGLYAGGLGSIPTAVTTRTAAGGDAEHISLNQ